MRRNHGLRMLSAAAEDDGNPNKQWTTGVLVAVAIAYLWCFIFALRHHYVSLQRRRNAPTPLQPLVNRSYHLQTGCHAFVRLVTLVLAFTTTSDSNVDTTLEQLKWAVLGDLPGLIFIAIYARVLLGIMTVCLSEEGRENAKLTLRNILCASGVVGLLAWAALVWQLTNMAAPGNTPPANEEQWVSRGRDILFGVLLTGIVTLALAAGCMVRRARRRLLIELIGVDQAQLLLTTFVIAACFLVRTGMVAYLGFTARKFVLVLQDSDTFGLVFNVGYFVVGEVVCAMAVSHLLRDRLFGDEHSMLLEKSCLNPELEINSKEITGMTRLASGGFGVVFHAKYRGSTVAVKKFLLHQANPRRDDGRQAGQRQRSFTFSPSSTAGDGAPAPGVEGGARWAVGALRPKPKHRQRFVQEAQMLAGLRHPRIIQLLGYTFFEGDQSFALVTEFMQGGNLFGFLHCNAPVVLRLQTALSVALDVARGVAYLHASDVIHRDLKSPNVLLDRNLSAKICDFGLAKFYTPGRDQHPAEPGSAQGTIIWTAPELLRSEPCSSKVDVYSYGVLLFEVFTRSLPYSSPALAPPMIITGVSTGRLRPRLHERATLSSSLTELMAQAWAHDPVDRPSFKELVRRLEAFQTTAPGMEIVRRPPQRRRR